MSTIPWFRLFWILSLLATTTRCRSRNSNDYQAEQSLSAAADTESESINKQLKEFGLDQQQILDQIQNFKRKPKSYWVLSARQLDQFSSVKIDTIRAVLHRQAQAELAIATGIGLGVAGVAMLFVPIPGSQSIGLIVIKNGLALALVYSASQAKEKFVVTRMKDVQENITWEPHIRSALNQIIQQTPAKLQIGVINDVKFNYGNFIEFETSENYRFVATSLYGHSDFIFVSRSHNWIKDTLPAETDHVLSLIDGSLIQFRRYRNECGHAMAARSQSYQEFLVDMYESEKSTKPRKIRMEAKSNRYGVVANEFLSGNIDREVVDAYSALSSFFVQLRILGGRDEDSKQDFSDLDVQIRNLVILESNSLSRLDKIKRLIDIYDVMSQVLQKRSEYLENPKP